MYQAGTLSGNPLAMAAGLATLRGAARRRASTNISSASDSRFAWDGLENVFDTARRAAHGRTSRGSMVGFFLTAGPVTNLSEAKRVRYGALRAVLPCHARPRRLPRALAIRGRLPLHGPPAARRRADPAKWPMRPSAGLFAGAAGVSPARTVGEVRLAARLPGALSHHTAPVEVRERHAFPTAQHGRGADRAARLRSRARSRDAANLRPARNLRRTRRLRSRASASQASSSATSATATSSDMDSYMYTLLGQPGNRSSLPREHGPRFDADRRSRDPRPSQRCVHPGPARALARQDAAHPVP